MSKVALVLSLALAACGAKSPAPATPAPPAAPAAPVTTSLSHLELGEMKVTEIGTDKAVLIHANGNIEVEGKVVAIVTAEGQMHRPDNTEPMMRLMEDGSLQIKDSPMPPLTFTREGTMVVEGQTVTLDDEGKFVGGGDDDTTPTRVAGATTPGLKRTAMFVMIGLTVGAMHTQQMQQQAQPQ